MVISSDNETENSDTMKSNVAFDPTAIDPFGMTRIVINPHEVADFIEERQHSIN